MDIQKLDWKKHTHIGLDLDETLAATMSGMLDHAHTHGNLEHLTSIEQIHSHDASGLGSHLTTEEVIHLWESYGKSTMHPSSVLPLEHALTGVKRLYEIGKELSIVTARSDKESWKVERTKSWVHTHLPFFTDEQIHFVNHFSEDALPKSSICKNYGISLLIDDALENAYELCDNGIACILLEKPWNREVDFHHPLLYRVKGWSEIITSLR